MGLCRKTGVIEAEGRADQQARIEVGRIDVVGLEVRGERAAGGLDAQSGEGRAHALPCSANCAAWCSVVSASISSPSASPAITCGNL